MWCVPCSVSHSFTCVVFDAWIWRWCHFPNRNKICRCMTMAMEPFGFVSHSFGIKLASSENMPKRCQNTLMYRRHIDDHRCLRDRGTCVHRPSAESSVTFTFKFCSYEKYQKAPGDAREKEAPRATTGWKLFADVCGRRCHVTSCDNCLEAALELRTSGSGNMWK